MLNLPFEENTQLRKDFPKLKPALKLEIGDRQVQNWSCTRLIENSNFTDWNCTERINGQTRFKEKEEFIWRFG